MLHPRHALSAGVLVDVGEGWMKGGRVLGLLRGNSGDYWMIMDGHTRAKLSTRHKSILQLYYLRLSLLILCTTAPATEVTSHVLVTLHHLFEMLMVSAAPAFVKPSSSWLPPRSYQRQFKLSVQNVQPVLHHQSPTMQWNPMASTSRAQHPRSLLRH